MAGSRRRVKLETGFRIQFSRHRIEAGFLWNAHQRRSTSVVCPWGPRRPVECNGLVSQ